MSLTKNEKSFKKFKREHNGSFKDGEELNKEKTSVSSDKKDETLRASISSDKKDETLRASISSDKKDETLGASISNKIQSVFGLEWSLRDKIILRLNGNSALLYSKIKLNQYQKDNVITETQTLINQLMNLNLKTEHLQKKLQLTDTSNGNLTILPSLEISWLLRKDIFNNLLINIDSAVLYKEETHDQIKKELIKENKGLINSLLNLKVIDADDQENDIEPDNSSYVSEEISEIIQKKFENCQMALKKQMVDIANKTIFARSEIVYTFKINDLKNFLKKDNKKISDVFYVRGFPFAIIAQNKIKDGFNSIDVFLNSEYEPKSASWLLRVFVQFRLVSHHCDVKELYNKFDFDFVKRSGVGIPDMISHQILQDSKNGYIKNDSFMIEIKLVADPPIGS